MPAVYALHGDYQPGVVLTNYLAVVGESTLWPGAIARKQEEVSDPQATTIAIVENVGEKVHWLEPRDLHYDSMSWRVNSPAGVSSNYRTPAVLMLDGTLRSLQVGLSEEILRALFTVNGGEPLAEEGKGWRLLLDGRLREKDNGNTP